MPSRRWAPRGARLFPTLSSVPQAGVRLCHLAGTPAQPSPSWVSSGIMMMTLPPARHAVGGSDTKTLRGLADAAGPVLTHDTRMPAVQRQGASPPGGTSKCAVHEKGAAEWLGYRQSQKLSKF